MHISHRRVTEALVSVWSLSAGCFTGEAAKGLPCGQDADCGTKLQCEEGFCGGAPPSTTEESTTDRTTSSGSSTSSSSDSSSGGPACGNGLADPGEVCDVARDPDGCTPLCQLAACGDGYWSPIEACDDSDPDPGAPSVEIDVDACTRQCYATAFWDDMGNADTSSTKWASSSDPMNSTGWSVREGAWASGTYPATATVVTLVASGIVLPSLQPDEVTSGAKIELRFTHSVAFDDCRGDPAPDGALIEVRGAFGTQPAVPVQPSGYPDVLAGPETCEATLDDPNPLASREVFASSGVDQAVRVDLTEYAGETVEIAFIVGYDCGNCGTPNDHAWTLDDVVIARFDPPR